MTVVHPSEFLPFVTSAPGKVIIFGEHSAVYNRPAIAASVSSLRTYLLVTKSDEPGSIRMDFPDINFSSSWLHQDLSAVSKDILAKSFETNELQPELIEFLKLPLSQLTDPLTRHAALCFLYLYMCLCPELTGIRFILKSTLPIGAGLGSSASTAVCLALAMGKLGGHIEINNESLSAADLTFVNKWSLVGEKCIHGTPSGIDNAVATYGNAVLFRRQEDGTTDFELLRDFPQLPIILTNTKIPKSTHVLVSNVRKLVDKQPAITTCILDAMEETANRAKTILLDLQSDSGLYKELLELVRVNHGLLVSLGVSHPGLEVVKSLSETLSIGATKLTGAGGGGCALTLLHRDADKQQLKTFIDSLNKLHAYESFTTDLGGMGCCYLARESMTYHQAEITRAFEEKNTTDELSAVLQPEEDAFVWIHG